MTTERPRDDIPEHERRPDTDLGAGIAGQGGTAPETGADRRAAEAGLDEDAPKRTTDIDDEGLEEPEDPDGPDAAYQPRSI
jgi:hypothetical protein